MESFIQQALIGTRSTDDDYNLECKGEVLKEIMSRLAEVHLLAESIPTTDYILGDKLHCQVKVDGEDVDREKRHIKSLKNQTSNLIEMFRDFGVDQSGTVNKYMDGSYKKQKIQGQFK